MSTVTIPKKIIYEGEYVKVPRESYEELLRIVKIIPKDQEWFWTKEWQAKEREVDRDIKSGRMSGPYRTKKDLASALKRLKRERAWCMELHFTKSFENDYRVLPSSAQKQLDQKLVYLLENPRHPSLRTKKMEGQHDIWEGRISKYWRFTFAISNNKYILRRAGTHDILRNP